MDLKIIETFARQRMAQDKTGHNIQHLERVVANAQRLMAAESQPIKTSIVLAAAWLHDIVDDKVTTNPAQARREVAELLIKAGATLPERDAILEIMDRQSFSKNLQERQSLSLEGQIVQDADRLDALGAIGIARTFYYGGSRGNDLYNDLPARDLSRLSPEDYRQNQSSLAHFDEKLLKLADLMNTASGRALAQERTAFMHQYLAQFWAEIKGEC